MQDSISFQSEGDKMCWLLGKTLKQQQQAVAAPVSSELEKHVKTLRDVVELELGALCETFCPSSFSIISESTL